MDKEQLDQLVRTVKQEHIKSLSSVLLDKSDDFYMKYRDVFLEKHFASYEVFENSKSTFDYRKRNGKFYDYYKNPQKLAWNALTSLIPEDENGNPKFKRFENYSIDFFKAEEELEIFFGQLKGIFKDINAYRVKNAESALNEIKERVDSSVTFKEVGLDFLHKGENGQLYQQKGYRKKAWSSNRRGEYKKAISIAIEHLGEMRVESISRDDISGLMHEVIENLPKANSIKGFNKLSLDKKIKTLYNEAISGSVEEDKKIAPKTQFENYKMISEVFKYYQDAYGCNLPEFERFYYKAPATNRRGRFSHKQINDIESFLDKFEDERKFPILLMAYGGLRNAEVMNIRKQDVYQDNGIYVLRITEEAGSVKTSSANRIIPVHSKLLELGFIDFCSSSDNEKVFAEVTSSKKFLTRFYSNRIKKECDIPDINNDGLPLSLYSLRHSFISELTIKNTPKELIEYIVGHSASEKSITKNYIHFDNYEVNKQYIDKVVYENNSTNEI